MHLSNTLYDILVIHCLFIDEVGGDPGDAAAISIGSIEDPGDGAAISDEKVEGGQLYFPTQNMMDLLVGSLSPACLSIHSLPIMAELDAIGGGTEAAFTGHRQVARRAAKRKRFLEVEA